MYSTNYYNTLIQVPSTCTLMSVVIPTQNQIAQLQFDLLYYNPYNFFSDDLLYLVYAKLNDIFEEDFEHKKRSFFLNRLIVCFKAHWFITWLGYSSQKIRFNVSCWQKNQ